jgi:putative methyltransferase (TIGR04325 family)
MEFKEISDGFMVMKKILKLFIPPIFINLFSYFKKQNKQKNTILKEIAPFKETQLSWDEALKETANGYSSELILTKCRDSLLKVKNGEFPYERDSVLFTEIEIFYPLLSSLLYVSSINNQKLNIIDFGGSLGSTYFQNRDLLKKAGITINWNIIEQGNFIEYGKEYFSNEELHFRKKIYNIPNMENIAVCLFSSVLPYLEEPYAVFDTIRNSNIKYIIIDRTYFLNTESEDVLTIQKVPPEIYEASYPAWFLSLNKFYDYIRKYYDIVFKWNALDQHQLEGHKTTGLGFLLKTKDK